MTTTTATDAYLARYGTDAHPRTPRSANTKPEQPGPVVVNLPAGADLSPALRAIESAYKAFQRKTGAPDVTVIIKRDERAWGHTTVAKVWAKNGAETGTQFEIMISGENLARGAEAVVTTLIHEASHAMNLASGVLDTDVNGRHNLKFKERAEANGLVVAARGWHGYTDTTMDDGGRRRWASMIKTVDAGLRKAAAAAKPDLSPLPVAKPVKGAPVEGGTVAPVVPVGPRRRGNRNLIKAVCDCGHAIRASKGLLDASAPICPDCETAYLPVGV